MEPITDPMIEALRANPVAPRDYISWLEQHGWGELHHGKYMLYSGLVALQDISPDAPDGFWSFGDDFAGCNGCFSESGDRAVFEWDSSTGKPAATGKGFPSYISGRASSP